MKFPRRLAKPSILLLLALPCAVGAQDGTYRTLRGYVFTRASLGGIDAWRTRDGKTWSARVGEFPNAGEVSSAGMITHSPATQACAGLGGRLPSLAEVQLLAGYFREPNASPSTPLTTGDAGDYHALFPTFSYPSGFSRKFWTTDAVGPGSARVSLGLVDPYGDSVNASLSLSVFCVAP
jgi:hypothetical protein